MRRNIRLLEIQESMMRALFIVPVLVLFFRDEIGLDFQDFLLCQTIFSISVIVFEIPSGWLSDIWNRKYVLALANLAWIIAFVILMFANNLTTAICVEVMMGLAIALFSGTNSAILYDSLICLGEKEVKDFARLEGRRRALSFYSVSLSSLAGGFLYGMGHYLPIILVIVFSTFGLIAALLIREPPRKKVAAIHHPIKDMLITMRYALHGHTIIAMIIIISSILFSTTRLIMWVQQPYYMELEIPEYMFGVLMAVGSGLGGFASHISHIISKHLNNFKALLVAWALAILVCIGAVLSLNYFGIFLLMFGGTFIYGAFIPQVQDSINKRVGSERRATILSTASFLRQIIFVPLALIVGWSMDKYGLNGAFYTIITWLMFTGVCLAVWSVKRQKQRNA